ncbi:MAG: methylated-DNA--[protein]-cysteine S-methyltransferase [Pseudomonadota bacterium]
MEVLRGRLTVNYTIMTSPIGSILLAKDDAIRVISIQDGKKTTKKPRVALPGWARDDASLANEVGQLHAYFAGELTEFDMVLEPEGTAFQCEVWRRLLTIPFGVTTTYGAIANEMGRPNASRAVGAANGANPIGIVVPCHRVVGASGALTGYGGGLENKAFLLSHEQRIANPESAFAQQTFDL